MVRKTIESRAALLFRNAPGEFDGSRSITESDLCSGMCVPLWGSRGIIGVLQADSRMETGVFTAIDLDLLTIFGCQLTAALEKLALFDRLASSERALQTENRRLRKDLRKAHGVKSMIGTSKPMVELLSLVDQLADTSATILIQGETGTGKELIARALHDNGPRAERPFIVQNCGALPEDLLASELFGHTKGAFTGAIADKRGRFEEADGGTIFLDEIGEMPKAMQVYLLRVLQDGEITRIGESVARHVDVRVLSATNRDLKAEVEAGRFREDLYYRIKVVQLDVPPLRERSDDIPLLANAFLERYASAQKKEVPGIGEEAMGSLVAYAYPGNVRELQNVIERVVSLYRGAGPIESKDLPPEFTSQAEMDLTSEDDERSMSDIVEDVKQRLIRKALDTSSTKVEAAKKLGITHQSLDKMMKSRGMKS